MSAQSVILPDFEDGLLQSVTVCAIFEPTSPIDPKHGEDRSSQTQLQTPSGDELWFRLLVDRSDKPSDKWHLHCQIGRDGKISGLPFLRSISRSDALARIEPLFGNKCKMRLSAEYSIPFENIPSHSIVVSMSDVSTEVGGKNLFVDGMSMTVSDDRITDLGWSIVGDVVEVSVYAREALEIGPNFLIDAISVLRDGIDRFILELDHADSDEKSSSQKASARPSTAGA